MDYSKHYAKFNPDTEEHFRQVSGWLGRRWSRYLPPDRNAKILDFGCGFGYAIAGIRAHGYRRATGIDSSQQQIEIAKRRGVPAEYTKDSLAWLRDHKNEFDFILCTDVLEHVPRAALPELVGMIHHALKAGGKFLCTVPNANSSFGGRYRYIDFTHEISFTEASLEFLLSDAGFDGINVGEDSEVPRLAWIPRPRLAGWYLLCLFRGIRRLNAVAEFGWRRGRAIPLSLNLLCTATRQK